MTMTTTHRLDAAVHMARTIDRPGALDAGAGQRRMARRLEMAAVVLDLGSDEDMAIAALLHDAPWIGQAAPLESIKRRFGPRIHSCVEQFSAAGAWTLPSAEWRAVRSETLSRLNYLDPDVQLLIGVEALIVARGLTLQLRMFGATALSTVSPDADAVTWWLGAIAGAYPAQPLTLVREIQSLASGVATTTRRIRVASDLDAATAKPARHTERMLQ